MLACFSALNESSNLDTSGESSQDSEDVPDYRDDDFLPIYNEALAKYGCDDVISAERKFRHLLDSGYIKQCGWESQKPRPIAVKLQYNSFRYLGECLGKRSEYEECLNCLQNAIEIDNSDRTLYFKYAVYATKFGKLRQARSALEAALVLNQPVKGRPSFPAVQHWPTLDLLISITYKLGDFISALSYIQLALQDDPKYEKGLRVRTKIYEECPWLNPDPSKQNDEPIMHSVIVTRPKPTKEIVVTSLKTTSERVSRLGQCLLDEYQKCGPTERLNNPCQIVVVEVIPDEPNPIEINDDVVETIEKDAEEEKNRGEKQMEVDETSDVESVQEIATSIVNDVFLDATRPSLEDFMMGIVMDVVADEVQFSHENNSAPTRRRGATSSFLSEVPLDLMEIRRSARGKGGYGGIGDDRHEEETAKSLLESYFTKSLKMTEEELAEEKKLQESSSPVKKDPNEGKRLPEASHLTSEEEKQLGLEMLQTIFKQNFTVLDGLLDFLLTSSEKLSHVKWPISLSDVYIRCYLIWRKHFVLPEDDDHPYVGIMILANEIVFSEAYIKERPPSVEIIDKEGSESGSEDEDDPMTEFVERDIEHLKFKLFRVDATQAIRIFSLHIQFYKWQDMTSYALSIGENLKLFLTRHCNNETEVAFSPIESYQLINASTLDPFLDSLRQNSMITRVSTLFDEKEYGTVQLILTAYLTKKKRKGTHQAGAYALRSYHLCMMIESLWNLEDYSGCLTWSEVALHEALEAKDKKLHQESDSNADVSKDLLDLLKMVECCLAMLDGEFKGLDATAKSRLAKNLLNLILTQIEGHEEAGLGVKTILPWMLLYKLISHEESKLKIDCKEIPGSLEFLCSAHDYLGPLSLCTIESGQILRLLIEKTVQCLFQVKGQKANVDHLCKHLDQAMYCLYAHPNKKSKLKHLVDHGVPNVAFTWDQCIPPYVYLRPEKLPEFDDFKSNSISADTMGFYKRVVAVVPDEMDTEGREAFIIKYLKTDCETFPRFPKPSQADEEFPRQLRDLFYLLGDYFFKNNEFPSALKYFRIDLTLNAQRVDSWFDIALALGTSLEPKINETDKDSSNHLVRITADVVKQILSDAEEVMRCFKLCIRLVPSNTTIQIESASFAYTMSSFCTRVESELENLSMELFTRLDKLKTFFLNFSQEHYNETLKIVEAQGEGVTTLDERWFLYLMIGKILSKKKKPLEDSINLYMKALDNLIYQGAAPIPKRISFNSPPELSLETLEVYYRIHVSILKEEFGDEFPPSDERSAFFEDVLDRVEALNLFVAEPKPVVKDDRSQSSETESIAEPPPAKIARVDVETESETSTKWDSIAQKCLKALDTVVTRFPQHFKALHRLSMYYLKSEKSKDIKKVIRYLWSNDGTVIGPNGNPIKVNALFSEKKTNNLFSGIWRYPLTEFDRAGNFSTHMGKCTSTLLDMAAQIKDNEISFEIAWHLKKPADGDRKYLFERERVNLEKQALTLNRQILKGKSEDALAKPDLPDATEEEKDKLIEERGLLLMDCHQYFLKMKRWWHIKDETIGSVMVDLYAQMVGKPNATLDDATNFCQRMLMMEKASSGSTSTRRSTLSESPQMITAAMIKTAKEPPQISCPKSTNPNNQPSSRIVGTGPTTYSAQLSSYYAEIERMMTTSNSQASAMATEALNSAAARGSLSITPSVGQTSSAQSKPSTSAPVAKAMISVRPSSQLLQRKQTSGSVNKSNLVSKQALLMKQAQMLKQSLIGKLPSTNKQAFLNKQMLAARQAQLAKQAMYRKSIELKAASSASKAPYFGGINKSMLMKKQLGVGTVGSYGSVPNLTKVTTPSSSPMQTPKLPTISSAVSISEAVPSTSGQPKPRPGVPKLGSLPRLSISPVNMSKPGHMPKTLGYGMIQKTASNLAQEGVTMTRMTPSEEARAQLQMFRKSLPKMLKRDIKGRPIQVPRPAQVPRPTQVPRPAQMQRPAQVPRPIQVPGPAQVPRPVQAAQPAQAPKPSTQPAPTSGGGGVVDDDVICID